MHGTRNWNKETVTFFNVWDFCINFCEYLSHEFSWSLFLLLFISHSLWLQSMENVLSYSSLTAIQLLPFTWTLYRLINLEKKCNTSESIQYSCNIYYCVTSETIFIKIWSRDCRSVWSFWCCEIEWKLV